MKTVKIKTLELRNFKKASSLKLEFNDYITNIVGDNAAGKTTIVDAWSWLISNKDSTGRKQFEIKTKNPDGTYIHKLEHEVNADLEINGLIRNFKKVLKESWVTKRGTSTEEMSGHETFYYIDEVPYKLKDFQKEIDNIFGGEEAMKLVSNVFYFNSLDWKQQSDILLSLIPKVSDEQVLDSMRIDSNKVFIDKIKENLNANKTIELYKKEVAAKQKAIKDEISSLPVRIDEVSRNIDRQTDFASIEKQITEIETEIESFESQLSNISEQKAKLNEQKLKEITELQNKKHELKFKYDAEVRNLNETYVNQVNDIETKLRLKNNELQNLKNELSQYQTSKSYAVGHLATDTQKRLDAGKEWSILNKKTFTFENNDACPTCTRPYPEETLLEQKNKALENFNLNKVKELKAIEEKGTEISNRINQHNTSIAEYDKKIEEILPKIDALNIEISSLENEKSKVLENQNSLVIPENVMAILVEHDAIVIPEKVVVDVSDNELKLKEQKQQSVSKRDELKLVLNKKQLNQQNEIRLQELTKQQATLNNALMQYEGIIFTINKYEETYANCVEKPINEKFKYVSFRLFKEQINGGIAPTCECMVNGVPYSDINTASKINAGLDIINTLIGHYGIKMPIFVDNKETITKLIDVDTQIITLTKVAGVETIKIE